MLHGDLVTITRRGVLVREKAVQDLGIYDNSQCWGVWIENPVKNSKLCRDRVLNHRHLVVSPFHPSSWPYLLRVQLWLKDRPGAMERACTLLQRCGLSILFAECAPSGFTHATWTVIAEVLPMPKKPKEVDVDHDGCGRRRSQPEGKEPTSNPDIFEDLQPRLKDLKRLRKKKQKQDRDPRFRDTRTPAAVSNSRQPMGDRSTDSPFDEVQELCSSTAAWMLGYADWAERRILQETVEQPNEQREECKLLFDWSDKSPIMIDKDQLTERLKSYWGDDIKGSINVWAGNQQEAAFPPKIDIQWIPALSFFAFAGAQIFDPMPMRYEASAACLMLEDGARIDLPQSRLRSLPMPAIASFSDRFKYIRLDPITPERLNHELTSISVEYETRATPIDERRHSMGLLGQIAGKLSARHIDLLHISNKWTEYRSTTEAGRVVLVADAPPDQYAEIEHDIRRVAPSQDGELRDGLSPGQAEYVKLTKVSASRYPSRRLFLSLHFGHPREESIREQIRAVAADHGFSVTVVQTFVEDASRRVREELTESDALLQILSFGKHEQPDQVEFPWLDYEFGLANGLEIPAMRLVDVVRVEKGFWERKIRTRRDLSLRPFRSDVSDPELRKVLGGAIAELARWVISRGH